MFEEKSQENFQGQDEILATERNLLLHTVASVFLRCAPMARQSISVKDSCKLSCINRSFHRVCCMACVFVIQKLTLQQELRVNAKALQILSVRAISIPPGHGFTLHAKTAVLFVSSAAIKVNSAHFPNDNERSLLLLQPDLQTISVKIDKLHEHVCYCRVYGV